MHFKTVKQQIKQKFKKNVKRETVIVVVGLNKNGPHTFIYLNA